MSNLADFRSSPSARRPAHTGRPVLASRRGLLSLLMLAPLGLATALRAEDAAPARTATWEELVPEDWNPEVELGDLDPARIREGSAEEVALMARLRKIWDEAPTIPQLEGQRLRLPGYVVPLEASRGKLREFLLVPYFGACIHTPPPPANQIVLVRLQRPEELQTMEAVWVSGRLSTQRRDSSMGMSGYALKADAVEPYP